MSEDREACCWQYTGDFGQSPKKQVAWTELGIPYVGGVSTSGGTIEHEIGKTVARLPSALRRFALHHCFYASVGGWRWGRVFDHWMVEGGTSWHLACIEEEKRSAEASRFREGGARWDETRHVILLDENMPRTEMQAQIAQCIGEAWANAHREEFNTRRKALQAIDPDMLPNPEYFGAVLAKEWGFTGKAAEPERFFRNAAGRGKPIWPFYDFEDISRNGPVYAPWSFDDDELYEEELDDELSMATAERLEAATAERRARAIARTALGCYVSNLEGQVQVELAKK